MAKRKQKKRVRRFNGYNLWDLGVAYAQTSILTNAAFNTNPIEFVVGDLSGESKLTGHAWGSSRISMLELATNWGKKHYGTDKTEMELVMQNIRENWADAAVKSVGLAVGTKVAKKLLSQPRRSMNKLFKAAGLNSVVRV